jgi:hypothetical protein
MTTDRLLIIPGSFRFTSAELCGDAGTGLFRVIPLYLMASAVGRAGGIFLVRGRYGGRREVKKEKGIYRRCRFGGASLVQN